MSEKSTTRIYLDYASLIPIDQRVVREMEKYSSTEYANPSSLYKEGVAAKKALEEARKRCGQFINSLSNEIIFTSGGTEANNLAIIGAVEKLRGQGVEYKDMHVITSIIEHSSVRECINYLNEREVQTDVIGVDTKGVVNTDELKKKIKPNTVIVSIMMVNNEIGTIQPIRDIAKIVRDARKKFNQDQEGSVDQSAIRSTQSAFNFQSEVEYPLLHTDAAQAALFNDLRVEKLGIDLMTIDGSKVYGPHGVGFLYKKRNVALAPILHGGGQESGLRSGTEPLPQIMGLAKALDLASVERVQESARVSELRAHFIDGLMALGKGIRINGIRDRVDKKMNNETSPHILNISIPRIDSEYFLLQLDAAGIACSTKSSCLRDEETSYVLKAIGADSKTSLRFSLGRWTKKGDVGEVLVVIAKLLS